MDSFSGGGMLLPLPCSPSMPMPASSFLSTGNQDPLLHDPSQNVTSIARTSFRLNLLEKYFNHAPGNIYYLRKAGPLHYQSMPTFGGTLFTPLAALHHIILQSKVHTLVHSKPCNTIH